MKRTLFVLFALFLLPAVVAAQALTNISSTMVRYNTRKATLKPQGELKAQIDAVDKEIADAQRLGKIGELRRQVAKGLALLDGVVWTPALDFQNSLALRSERTMIDSSAPYSLRLEQNYSPSIELTPAITARVTLRSACRSRRPGTRRWPRRRASWARSTATATCGNLRWRWSSTWRASKTAVT